MSERDVAENPEYPDEFEADTAVGRFWVEVLAAEPDVVFYKVSSVRQMPRHEWDEWVKQTRIRSQEEEANAST